MAAATSLEREEDVPVEAAVTTTEAADDAGEDVEAVETVPAAKLLLVERGKTMIRPGRVQHTTPRCEE